MSDRKRLMRSIYNSFYSRSFLLFTFLSCFPYSSLSFRCCESTGWLKPHAFIAKKMLPINYFFKEHTHGSTLEFLRALPPTDLGVPHAQNVLGGLFTFGRLLSWNSAAAHVTGETPRRVPLWEFHLTLWFWKSGKCVEDKTEGHCLESSSFERSFYIK